MRSRRGGHITPGELARQTGVSTGSIAGVTDRCAELNVIADFLADLNAVDTLIAPAPEEFWTMPGVRLSNEPLASAALERSERSLGHAS